MKNLSPLRYPGGKANLINFVVEFLEANRLYPETFVEPYAGGASISLGLLSKGVVKKVLLVERDPLVFSFWRAVFEEPEKLCELIADAEIDIDSWERQREWLSAEKPDAKNFVEMGFAALFLNRTAFSGIMHAGPIGGYSQSSVYDISCRFYRESLVQRIREISNFSDLVSVCHSDGMKEIKVREGSDCFFYVDPPYYLQGQRLYRHHFYKIDHILLSRVLQETDCPFLLSYDEHDFIRELYSWASSFDLRLAYAAKVRRVAAELLFSNPKAKWTVDRDIALAKVQKWSTDPNEPNPLAIAAD